MSARKTFGAYVQGPLKNCKRGDPGLENIHDAIYDDVQRRLLRSEYIVSLTGLLRWASERWPTYFTRKSLYGCGPQWVSLDLCMKVLWADYLAWAEAE